MSQFRQNPISRHWVLIAPNRAKRLEELKSQPAMPVSLPELVPQCIFCPGNESKNPELAVWPKKGDWQIRIIPNKFEALSNVPFSRKAEFYVSRAGAGNHEVIITRKHNEPVALQSVQTVELTFQVFRQRFLDLMENKYLFYAQIFHNHGRDAGASLIHPHYQIMATPMVPTGISDEMRGCYDYYQVHKACIYCEIMEEERKMKQRIIFETEYFLVLSPYAARSPFETWILPKKHSGRFEEISDDQITHLAYVLKVTLGQLYVKLSDPPLNFYIHTLPFPDHKHIANEKKAYHWHLVIFPRISIWAGFEFSTGIPVNPVTPESAAEFLR